MQKINKLSSLSIIPVYNEEARILDTLKDIYNNISNYPGIFILNSKNTGKGGAVKRGVLQVKKDFALFIDDDNSTNINQLEFILPFIHDFEVIIGSRELQKDEHQRHEYFHRKLMGKVFNYIVRKKIGITIYDTQCGFKLFRKKSIKVLYNNLKELGFAFDVEILYKANKRGLKIKEVGVDCLEKYFFTSSQYNKVVTFKPKVSFSFLDFNLQGH